MALNLACILECSARRYPDHTALIHRGRSGEIRMSYAEVRDGALRLASALQGLGVGRGDRVALMLPNVPEFTIAYFAILAAGGTVVPLNTLFVADEIGYVLEDSDAVLFIASTAYEEAARAAAERVPSCRKLVLVTRDPGAAVAAGRSFAELLAGAAPADTVQTMPDDTAVILYTSGTTGRPKGAELSHFNLYANAQWCSERSLSVLPDRMVYFGPGYAALGALPLFHSFGQTCVQNAMLFHGGAMVCMSRWDPEEALQLMEELGVTNFAGVPTMYFGLLEAAGTTGCRLERLACCTSGGAPMPVEMMREFEDRYPVRIMEGYGLSETSPVATFHTPEIERKPGTVGKAIDGCEVAVFDDSDRPLAAGEVGEVVIRGHNIFKGYYKRPEATSEAMRGGWFHSGDLGTLDEEGYLQIVDRKKDMILRGGFNVYPREIEEVLYAHPAIGEAAVIGIPDVEHGEEVVAVVALREGAALTATALISYCKQHMAPYKYPRHVEFRDSLPKGGTGKILKRALRDEIRSGPSRS